MRIICLFLMLSSLFLSKESRAFSCGFLKGEELIKSNNLIFRGKAIKTKKSYSLNTPDSYTVFKVEELIKGNPDLPIKIYHRRKKASIGGQFSFKLDQDAYIFARKSQDGRYYQTGPCNAPYYLSSIKMNSNYRDRMDNIFYINEYIAQKEAADKLIKEFNSIESYTKKGDILEEYKDFEQAEILYADLISLVVNYYKVQTKQNKLKEGEHRMSLFPKNGGAGHITDPKFCSNIYGINDNTPDFLKLFKNKNGKETFISSHQSLFSYANILDKLGKHKEALRPLCLYNQDQNEDAAVLKNKLLIILNRKKELNHRPIHLQKSTISQMDLSNLDIERSNFSNGKFGKIDLTNSKLIGSDYSGSKISRITTNNTNLSGSIFSNAYISGEIKNTDLSYIDAENLEIKGSLDIVDLSNSNLQGAKIRASLDNVNLENSNLKGASIYSLAGANTKNANLNHINSFSHKHNEVVNFKDVDFSNADLSRSSLYRTDFTGGSFKNTNLTSANLSGSILKDIDFSGSNLQNADLRTRGENQTNIKGADFSNAIIKGVKWNGAIYNCDTKFPEGFNPAINFMISDDKECKTAINLNYSWENLISAPNGHYRILNPGMISNFKNMNLDGANFEGRHMNLRIDSRNGQTVKTHSYPSQKIFENVSLKNSNFKYSQSKLKLTNVDLENADFRYSKVDIRNSDPNNKINLKNAKFFCASMSNIYVDNETINEADLTGALFNARSGTLERKGYTFNPIKKKIIYSHMQQIIDKFGPADYTNMNFDDCDLTDVNFGTTDLSGSTFRRANLNRASFENAKLDNTNFNGARMTSSTKMFRKKSKLDKTRPIINKKEKTQISLKDGLSDKNSNNKTKPLNRLQLDPLDLRKKNFINTRLPQQNMSRFNISFSDFSSSNLSGVNFTNAKAIGTVFTNTVLYNANFTNTNLEAADFRGADMQGSILINANLKNSIYDLHTTWPTGFNPDKYGSVLIGTKEEFFEPIRLEEKNKFKNISSNTEVISLGFREVRRGCDIALKKCETYIKISKKDKPIFLVLSAYESSIWNIEIDDGVNLEGIIVSGHNPQIIKGVPGRIKIVNFSDIGNNHNRPLDRQTIEENNSRFNYNNQTLKFYTHDRKNKSSMENINRIVKSSMGKKIDKVLGSHRLENYTID